MTGPTDPPVPPNGGGPVTYGDLVDLARGRLLAAMVAFAAYPPGDGDSARVMVSAYRELLDAHRAHLERLIGPPGRIQALREARAPIMAAQDAVHLYDALKGAVQRRPTVRPLAAPDSAAGHWLASARALRAATDLLATHTDPAGAHRGPDAHLLHDPQIRAAAVRQGAELIAAAAETGPLLWRAARAVGVRHLHLARTLPDLAAVRDHARQVLTPPTPPQSSHAALARVGVAVPTIRCDHPLHELSDRVAVVRVLAWRLTDSPTASLTSLADIARLATYIESARFRLTAAPATPLTPDTAPTAGAWHATLLALRQLRGDQPPDPDIRTHTRAAETLLRDIVRTALPPPGAPDTGQEDVHADHSGPDLRRAAAPVLRRTGDQLGEIATWNHATLTRLAVQGHLYPLAPDPAHPGRDQPARRPGRHTAHHLAPLDPDDLEAVTAAYHRIHATHDHRPMSTALETAGPSHTLP